MAALRAQAGSSVRGRRLAGVLLALAVFGLSWYCLGHWWYAHGRIVDTPFYQSYGLQMRLGALPYRDFQVEYPPGALPAFLVPTYFGQPTFFASYATWFARLMLLCGLGCLVFVMLSRASWRSIGLVAVSPLLVGYLLETRFDLWPALFVSAAVAAFLHDRYRLGWFALALAVTAKLYALVLIPIAVVWTLRRRGRAEAGAGIAIFVVTVAAVFAPFALLAPHGLWESLWAQVSRPIQIESLAGALLSTFGHPREVLSNNSVSLSGHGWLQALTTVIEVGCLAALWVGFARGQAEEDRFLRYCAGCVAAFVAFGKVLSPQYLIWLVPLVPLVRGRRGLVASGLLALALVGTQFYFTASRYRALQTHFDYAWIVLARDLVLVALLAVVALPASPGYAGDARANGP
jgi:uncharacterized membrane protein